MKNLIRDILKESVDNRIVNILIKRKLPTIHSVINFLIEIGYTYNESKEIYVEYFKTISGLKLTPTAIGKRTRRMEIQNVMYFNISNPNKFC